MNIGGHPKAAWRIDYPPPSSFSAPWEGISFATEPAKYMRKVLDSARVAFRRDGDKLVGSGNENWWISLWLDYGSYGREPLMGLTKERGPNPGDLSETSGRGYQVWAVGFYNAPGASVFREIFAQPCDPKFASSLKFPVGTASVKFLFTDASDDEVRYLKGAPTYQAVIDEKGSGSAQKDPTKRDTRALKLLQVDIAVRDDNASKTGWVFGTFAWIGPTMGDGLFDNLVPVSLQWGNDEGVYNSNIKESWINPDLSGKIYGWSDRPTVGFHGRANGPADNIRSSCLSCHAAARIPRSPKGLLDSRFDWKHANDTQVKQHVDTWFKNIKGGELFDPGAPAVTVLDYSLQLDAASSRICDACKNGALRGRTPKICIDAKLVKTDNCKSLPAGVSASFVSSSEGAPPRQ
jgi:hypothetical protein